MSKDTAIKLIISVGTLVLLVVRLVLPNLQIDSITIGLLVVCILPWAPSFVNRLKAPGGWEIELNKVKSTLGTVIDASSEDAPDTAEPTSSQHVELTDNELAVLKVLTKAHVPLRSVYGICKDTGLDSQEVQVHLNTLDGKGLATKVEGKKGLRWGITPSGRRRLETS